MYGASLEKVMSGEETSKTLSGDYAYKEISTRIFHISKYARA